jgi:hypothetical protein
MSLANIQGKLSRAEMKNIMAGSGSGQAGNRCTKFCDSTTDCSGDCPRCYAPAGGVGQKYCQS